MGFVHDDELGAFEFKVGGVAVALDEVGGNDNDLVPVKHGHADGQIPFQPLDGAAEDQFGLDMKLFRQFLLPLLGQVGRAQYGETIDFASVQHFPGDERGFHGLADADVVSDEQAHGVQFQGHHEGHQLIGARLHGDAGEAAEGARGGTGGQPGGIAQKPAGSAVAEVVPGRQWKGGGFDRLDNGQDAGDLLVEAAHGPDHEQVVGGFGQHHPFAAPGAHERARLG